MVPNKLLRSREVYGVKSVKTCDICVTFSDLCHFFDIFSKKVSQKISEKSLKKAQKRPKMVDFRSFLMKNLRCVKNDTFFSTYARKKIKIFYKSQKKTVIFDTEAGKEVKAYGFFKNYRKIFQEGFDRNLSVI